MDAFPSAGVSPALFSNASMAAYPNLLPRVYVQLNYVVIPIRKRKLPRFQAVSLVILKKVQYIPGEFFAPRVLHVQSHRIGRVLFQNRRRLSRLIFTIQSIGVRAREIL